MGRKYHVEHFICSYCTRQLQNGTFKNIKISLIVTLVLSNYLLEQSFNRDSLSNLNNK